MKATFAGSVDVTTDGFGQTSFSAELSQPVLSDQFVTETAIDEYLTTKCVGIVKSGLEATFYNLHSEHHKLTFLLTRQGGSAYRSEL